MDEKLRNRQKRLYRLIDAIAEGKTTEPECPTCGESSIKFSFTLVDENRYGLFILCENCKEFVHARLNSRPPGFDEKFVLEEFQQREEEVVGYVRKLLKLDRD